MTASRRLIDSLASMRYPEWGLEEFTIALVMSVERPIMAISALDLCTAPYCSLALAASRLFLAENLGAESPTLGISFRCLPPLRHRNDEPSALDHTADLRHHCPR